MKNKKITIAVALILVIFFILSMLAPAFVHASEIVIYEKAKEEIITKGVTKKNIVRFTKDGWLNINVIKADLGQKYIGAELLTDSRGMNQLSNVLNLAKENNAIAAINGDFFQWLKGSKNYGSPIGVEVKDGQLISTPAHEKGMGAMSIDDLSNIVLDYWTHQVTITAPNGKTATVKHINKFDPLDSIIMYDRSWAAHSGGSDNNKVEIVVENNIVKEIRREMPPVLIPEDGYVLCNLPEYDPFLIENFKVGDPINVSIATQPNIDDLKMAIGGGAILVKDGKQVPFSHNIRGKHPRSAVGTDASGKILYLVTVDGRQITSKGMSQEELAQLMIELGAYQALNLDGGGSTTLVSKSLGNDNLNVVNKPSDGWLRNVSNAIGITTSAPRTEVAGLVIESANENVFVNTSRSFSIKAYDQYFNAVEIATDKIKWEYSGVEGKFIDNTFYPASVGHGIVKATYGNISATYEIDVLSEPAAINIKPKRIDMKTGDNVTLSLSGTNRFGYSAPMSVSDVTWSLPEGVARIEGNTLVALKSGVGIATASIGEVNTHAMVSVDVGSVTDDFEKINGSFLPYPSYVEGDYTLSSDKKRSGTYSGKLSYDFTTDHNESKAAYLTLSGDGIPVASGVKKVGVWVYANKYMEHWLRGGIRDKDNNFHRINFTGKIDWEGWKYVEAEIPEDIPAPMRLTRLYVVQIDPSIKNKGAIYFDDLALVDSKNRVTNIELPEDKRLPDELNKEVALASGENNFRFSVFGNTLERKTLLDNIIMQKAINTFNKTSSLSAFVGNINPKTLDGLKTKYLNTSGHYMFDFNGSTFMYMDNTNDGFRKTNSNQWVWLKDNIDKITSNNVFIFLPKPLTGQKGFTDIQEAQLFKDMLTERLAKKGKNVFVFYNDDETICNIDRGVRYISTPGIKEVDENNIVSLVKDYQYILVTVNGNDVTYEIKNLFE